MANVYIYVVDRDFGFAPNPFHNICTLATCKPDIRRVAKVGDWIIGMGGRRLKATGKCIFAMEVSKSITFDDYWADPAYRDKKPLRNGSMKTIVGDNIYHRANGSWQQSNSHHSHPDGTPNQHNVLNDTRTNAVLISDNFFYFGAAAIKIPAPLLEKLGYRNSRGHRKFTATQAQSFLAFLSTNFRSKILYGDPFDFEAAKSRYSVKNNKITPHT